MNECLDSWAESKGLAVATAGTLHGALEYITKAADPIVITLVDYRISKVHRSRFLRALKRHNSKCPVLLLIQARDPLQIREALEEGIHSIILDPWSRKYLTGELDKTLELHQLRNQRAEIDVRIRNELHWAGELQRSLLRTDLPNIEAFSYNVTYEPVPSLMCGGDYYDIIRIGDTRYAVMIGDVSGHGVKAALITAVLKTIINAASLKAYGGPDTDPSRILRQLNRRLQNELEGITDIIVTFLLLILNTQKMSFTFSSAGHLPFYLLRSGSLLKMHCPGSALCIDPNAVYIGKAVGVQPGDRIVLYTDGLIETGAKGVEDEEELFESILKKYAKRKDLNDAVISGLKKRTGISAFIDDVTMLSLDLSS